MLLDIKNNIDFFIRNKFPYSRKNYSEKNESKKDIFASDNEILRFNFLKQKYNIDYLENNSTRINFLENLYFLDILDKYFDLSEKETISAIDIGCRNWSYVKGENAYLEKYCSNLDLSGIEIDYNRLYFNLFSRCEAAKFYMKGTSANYIKGDFLNINKKFDCMLWFLPFIFEETQEKYGLPIKNFSPEKLLLHAYELLNDNGRIFIVNQGKLEHEAQIDMCKKFSIPFYDIGKIESLFLHYNNERFALIINKQI